MSTERSRSHSMKLEVCVESVAGALAAAAGGAQRVELCADLLRGGTTPGPSAIRLAIERCSVGVVVLVRPRAGDFCYDHLELEEMCADVRFAVEAGAAGVAIGALTPDGRIDLVALERFMEAAEGLPLTFHRAFDWCVEPHAALEQLVASGVQRLLSSGGAASAVGGRDALRELVSLAGRRIEIVAAGGVRAHNVAELIEHTGVRELHSSAFKTSTATVHTRAAECPLSSTTLPRDDERRQTSAELVRELRAAMDER